ncbi:MAG: transposase [Thermodesulfobacteriota bacterium]
MSNYKRSKDGSTFFFTVVTYKREPILCLDESRKALREIIDRVRELHQFEIKAWVLLPDHLHAIWEFTNGDFNYSMIWGLIKKEFTKKMKHINPSTPLSPSRKVHREGAIWQRRFWEHTIRDEVDFRTHVDYIHYNPVKHGLVASPAEWEHSTFNRFVEEGVYPKNWGSNELEFSADIGRE